jgi:hypothetical protein
MSTALYGQFNKHTSAKFYLQAASCMGRLNLGCCCKNTRFVHTMTHHPVPYRCHMYGSHLPLVDVSQVLGVSAVWERYTPQRPLYSSHSLSGSIPVKSFGQLLRLAVVKIVHKPLRIEETIKVVAAAMKETNDFDIVLTTVGSI